MRKIIAQIMVSIDGYMEDSEHQLTWHVIDDEYHSYSYSLMETCDKLIFGRKTFEHMSHFWPTEKAKSSLPYIAAKMNNLKKLIISNTLNNTSWENSNIVHDQIVETLKSLKQKSGKNLLILASSELVHFLLSHQLIDEIHYIINPVALGNGVSYFKMNDIKRVFSVLDVKSFSSGNILIIYSPKFQLNK
ncbi:dihydrofolate reductase family protein [Alkalihalobacillus trypoxylicola]|uniref:Bacterial bifunctional deaminase-reductase C-terminal domain-containing protein n=1 Tax=Alkalihalobacillus trypoxylicola TaxID=519424 RepID=A0A161PAP7_9BACI|nr:dihydrofolate reductase family protein [Alkalihalobacillus trypoxylicola]KYG29212.1 hypothetical protein AZF04_06715 [Alkalihalobacillus trypoxylicola]